MVISYRPRARTHRSPCSADWGPVDVMLAAASHYRPGVPAAITPRGTATQPPVDHIADEQLVGGEVVLAVRVVPDVGIWTVPASVDTRLSCPIRRESEKWVRHAAHLRGSTRSSR